MRAGEGLTGEGTGRREGAGDEVGGGECRARGCSGAGDWGARPGGEGLVWGGVCVGRGSAGRAGPGRGPGGRGGGGLRWAPAGAGVCAAARTALRGPRRGGGQVIGFYFKLHFVLAEVGRWERRGPRAIT